MSYDARGRGPTEGLAADDGDYLQPDWCGPGCFWGMARLWRAGGCPERSETPPAEGSAVNVGGGRGEAACRLSQWLVSKADFC